MPAPLAPVFQRTTSNIVASAFSWLPAEMGDQPTHYRVEYRALRSQTVFDAVGAGTMPRPADSSSEWETWLGGNWPVEVPYIAVPWRAIFTPAAQGGPPTRGLRVRIRSENADGHSPWIYIPTDNPEEAISPEGPADERRGMLGFSAVGAEAVKPVVSVDPTAAGGFGFTGYCHGGGGESGLEIYVLALFEGRDTNPRTGNIVRETIVLPNQTWAISTPEQNTEFNFSLRVVGVDRVQRETRVIASRQFESGEGYIATTNVYTITPPVDLNTGVQVEGTTEVTQIKLQTFQADEEGNPTAVTSEINVDFSPSDSEADRRAKAEAAAQAIAVAESYRSVSAGVDFISYLGGGLLALGLGGALGVGAPAAGGLTTISGAPIFNVANIAYGSGPSLLTLVGGTAVGTPVAVGVGTAGGLAGTAGLVGSLADGIEDFAQPDSQRDILVHVDRSSGRISSLVDALRAGQAAVDEYVDRVNEWGQEQVNEDGTPQFTEDNSFEEVNEAFEQDQSRVNAAAEEARLAQIATQQAIAQALALRDATRTRIERNIARLRDQTTAQILRQERRGVDERSEGDSYTEGEFENFVEMRINELRNNPRPAGDTGETADLAQQRLDAARLGQSLVTFRGDVRERWLDPPFNLISGVREITTPPTIVRIGQGVTSLTPIWTEVAAAESYTLEVYPATGDLTAANRLQSIADIAATTATVTGLAAQTEYRLRVRAIGLRGRQGPWSDLRGATTVTPVPVGVSVAVGAVTASTAQYTLTAVDNAASYEVQRSTTSTFSASQPFTTTDPTTAIDDSGLSGATQYFVRARATGLGGTGPWGATVSFTTLAAVPGPIAQVNVSGITENSAIAEWTAAHLATSYTIEWSTSSSFATTSSTSSTSTSHTITGLQRNTTYYVRITPSNAAGNGPVSPAASFTTSITTGTPTIRVTLGPDGGIQRDFFYSPQRTVRVVNIHIDLPTDLQSSVVLYELQRRIGESGNWEPIGGHQFRNGIFTSTIRNGGNPHDTTIYYRAMWQIHDGTRFVPGPWSTPVSFHTPDIYDTPTGVYIARLNRLPGGDQFEIESVMPPEFLNPMRGGQPSIARRYQVSTGVGFADADLVTDSISSILPRNNAENRNYLPGDFISLGAVFPRIDPNRFERLRVTPSTTYYMRFAYIRGDIPNTPNNAFQQVTRGDWSSILQYRTLPAARPAPPRVLFTNFTSAQVEVDAAGFPAENIVYILRWGQDGTTIGTSRHSAAGEHRIGQLATGQGYWTDYRIEYTNGNGVTTLTEWSPRANILTPLYQPPADTPDPLEITNVGPTQATATWSAIPSIGQYRFTLFNVQNGESVVDEIVSGNQYNIGGLEERGRYRARVYGIRYGVLGPPSREVTFETFAGAREEPNILTPIPPTVSEAFTRDRQVAILVRVNFGPAFGGTRQIVRRYSLAGHDVVYAGETYAKTDQLLGISGVSNRLGIEKYDVRLTFANKGDDIISFVQAPYAYRYRDTQITYALLDENGGVTRARTFVYYNMKHEVSENVMDLVCVNFWRNLETLNGIRTSHADQIINIRRGTYNSVDPNTGEQRGTGPGAEDAAFNAASNDFSVVRSGRIRRTDRTNEFHPGASPRDDGEDYTRAVPYGEGWLHGNVIQAWNPTEEAISALGVSWVPGPERSDTRTLWTTVVYAVAEGELDNLDIVFFDMKPNDIDRSRTGASFTFQTSGDNGYFTVPLLKEFTPVYSGRPGEADLSLVVGGPRVAAVVERSLGTDRGARFVKTAALSSNNREWTLDHIGAGTALVAVTFKAWSNQGWTGGWPNIAFRTRGKLIRSLDSAGVLQPSTNPADVIYDYLTSRRYGCSVPPGIINLRSFETARSNYTRRAGTLLYTSFLRGLVDSSLPVGRNLQMMLEAAQSELFLAPDGRLSLLAKTTITATARREIRRNRLFTADKRGPLDEVISSPPDSRYNRARVVSRVTNRTPGETYDHEVLIRSADEEDFFVKNEVQIANPFLSIPRSRRNEIAPGDLAHLRANAIHAIMSSRNFLRGRFLVPDGLWGRYSNLQVGSIIAIGSNRRGWIGDKALIARIVRLDVVNGGDYVIYYQQYSDDIYNVGGPVIEPAAPIYRGASIGGNEAEPGETLDRLGEVPLHTFVIDREEMASSTDANGFHYTRVPGGNVNFNIELGEYDFGQFAGAYTLSFNPSSGLDDDILSLSFAVGLGGDRPTIATPNDVFYRYNEKAQFQVDVGTEDEKVWAIMRCSAAAGYRIREDSTFTLNRHKKGGVTDG